MAETVHPGEDAVLEVVSPDGARRYVRVAQSPFLIGRGAETGNHLQLSDRRISNNCAAILIEANRFYLEDRGQRRGLFINGEKVESRELQNGDVITFGLEDSYEILFRSSSGSDEAHGAIRAYSSENASKPDFTIRFDGRLSPEQIVATLKALSDYYRACGGAGLAIDPEIQELRVESPVGV